MSLSATFPTNLSASELLDLERINDLHFRSNRNLHNLNGSIFGGALLGQGVAACTRTVEGWSLHNCSAYFLGKTHVAEPLDFHVERTRDGRSFAMRRVLARQRGEAVFDMICSFHGSDPGPAHAQPMAADIPPPESLMSSRDFVTAHADRFHPTVRAVHMAEFPVELRPIDPEGIFFGEPGASPRTFWIRVPSASTITDPRMHHALLAFLSDYWLAGAASAGRPRLKELNEKVGVLSLNHAMWFHAPVRSDDWLLYTTGAPWAGNIRGLTSGFLYDRAGNLVATVAQEVSVRL